MSSQYRNFPDKVLRVRTHDGLQHFWPVTAFRGARRVSNNNLEIYFDTMLRQDGGDASTHTVDVVRILFSDTQLGLWGSMIRMWEKVMTGKAIVFTIADTYAEPPFYNLQGGKTERDPDSTDGNGNNTLVNPALNETNLNATVVVEYMVAPANLGPYP